MTEEQALNLLKRMVRDGDEPTLTTDEVADLLLGARRPDKYLVDIDVDGWSPTYDLNAAAAEGWLWKAGKVAGAFSFSSDQQSFNRAEMHTMCLRQHDYYRRKITGSFPLSAGWLARREALDVVGNAS